MKIRLCGQRSKLIPQGQLAECEARLKNEGSSSSSSGSVRVGRVSSNARDESSDDSQRPGMNAYGSEDDSSDDESDDDGGRLAKERRDGASAKTGPKALPARSISAPAGNYLSLGVNTFAMDQSAIMSSSDDESDDDEDVSAKGLMPRRDGKIPQNATQFGGTLAPKRAISDPLPQSSSKRAKKSRPAVAESSSDDDDLPF